MEFRKLKLGIDVIDNVRALNNSLIELAKENDVDLDKLVIRELVLMASKLDSKTEFETLSLLSTVKEQVMSIQDVHLST
jgi:hypothetical protein